MIFFVSSPDRSLDRISIPLLFVVAGRLAKFFQSFSILSSTYIIVAMAVDRCIAIVKPLKAGKIRVILFSRLFSKFPHLHSPLI